MNWIGSLAFLAAVALGHPSAQTAAKPGGPGSTPPPPKEPSVSRVGNTVHISVGGPRPLEQAIDALRLQYGWVISYEDPQYLSPKDVTEAAGSKGSLLPAGHGFSVTVPADSPTDAPPEEKSLKLIVDAYNRSGNPGQFELRKSEEGAFALVGVAALDEKGVIAAQKALLDSTITMSVEQRTIDDTVDVLCRKLAEETHVPVSVGITPRKLVEHTNVKAGGTKSPARAILAQSLAASGRPMYWRLLFDPNTKSYLLNIHWVQPPKEQGHENQSRPPRGDVHP
jgi:hypothetical protein